MIVTDASVWVSSFKADEANHAFSTSYLEYWTSEDRQVSVPILLLAEVSGAIVRRTSDPDVARRVADGLLDLSALLLVDVERRLAAEAAQVAAELRLRGADAVYIALAVRLGVPLVTWDREQRERASAVVDARSPA